MCDFELGWRCSCRDRQDPASRERLRLISLPLKKCNYGTILLGIYFVTAWLFIN